VRLTCDAVCCVYDDVEVFLGDFGCVMCFFMALRILCLRLAFVFCA